MISVTLPLTTRAYLNIRELLAHEGYADDYEWSQKGGSPPMDAWEFASEHAFVVCNSGMKATIATAIYHRVVRAKADGLSARAVFGHEGKARAIDHVFEQRRALYSGFIQADDKLAYCESLPWIGPITKYHLAKNFGVDCAKPDRHLVRIAGDEGVDQLCARLAQASGDRVATVDLIIWRAASLGWL